MTETAAGSRPRSELYHFFAAYRAFMRVGFAMMVQYRFAVVIWAVWGFVGPLVSLAVWNAASGARGGSIAAGGTEYGRADFAAYFLTFMVFSHLTMSWDAFEFGWRVRSGSLSPLLLRPVDPIHADACRNVAYKLFSSAIMLPFWIVLVLLLRPAPPASLASLALAVPALLLGAIMRYVLQYALALAAFWTTRVEAIQQLYFSVDAFLGGRIAPLALMPGWLGVAAQFSPFRGMGSFPVELALGRVPSGEILPGFLLQIVWIGVAVAIYRLLWTRGIRQYSAVGA
jgi:ABC-2 type transport system permease protein